MSLPLLILTDGTTTVDLLSRTGYHLSDWRPMIAPFKNDGLRRSSVISEGSRLVGYQYDNVIETFTLELDERSQDGAARQLILLNRLLVKGVDYWARGGVNEPVWIAARSGDEQYTRYATVMNYKMESIGNPYGAEFLGSGGDKLGMAELVLTVERGHWMENPPKVGASTIIHTTWENPDSHIVYGRADYSAVSVATQEVFVANKFSNSNITHVYNRTAAGAFGGNLVGAGFPYILLPVVPGTGDAVYFGSCNTATTEGGPFNCLVFDLLAAAGYIPPASGEWQYWDAASNSWHACFSVYDRTAVAANQPLSIVGVKSVHWLQRWDIAHAWEPTGAGAHPGDPAEPPVLGWWIRMIITIGGGGSIGNPVQHDREIYTANEAYVEVDAEDLTGDVDAITNISISARSEQYQPVIDMYRDVDFATVGLRSRDRENHADEVFNAYLNLSDSQEPAWLTPTILHGATTHFDPASESPTGRGIHFVAAGALAMTDRMSIEIASTHVADYYGTYRAFIRYRNTVGVTYMELAVKKSFIYGGLTTWVEFHRSATVMSQITAPGNFEFKIADMGVVNLPGLAVDASAPMDSVGNLHLVVSTSTLIAAEAMFYDIVLIPADEWLCSTETPWIPSVAGKMTCCDPAYIEIDSISMPTELVRCKIYDVTNGMYSGMLTVTNGHAILHPKRAQRYWFLCGSRWIVGTSRRSNVDIALSASVSKSQRYLTLRGAE
jgi:hypothetical protein